MSWKLNLCILLIFSLGLSLNKVSHEVKNLHQVSNVLYRSGQPNRAGMGTHQQLGLPPCTFDTIFGIRCPTCGMTTSWSHLMHGDLAASWSANPGGTCLAVATMLGAAWAIAAAARGVASPQLPRGLALASVLAIVAVTLMDWVSKILR